MSGAPLLPMFPPDEAEGIWAGGVNVAVCVSGVASRDIDALMVDALPDAGILPQALVFPRWTYGRSGRGDNVTRRAVRAWRCVCGDRVDADWLFSYFYGAMHHAGFRRRFADSWRTSPERRIPFLSDADRVARLGGELGLLHLGFDRPSPGAGAALSVDGGDLRIAESGMRYDADAGTLRVNDATVIRGIPRARYRVAGRRPLEWWCACFRRRRDPGSGIVNDGSRAIPPERLVAAVGHLARMAVESDRIIAGISASRMLPAPDALRGRAG